MAEAIYDPAAHTAPADDPDARRCPPLVCTYLSAEVVFATSHDGGKNTRPYDVARVCRVEFHWELYVGGRRGGTDVG